MISFFICLFLLIGGFFVYGKFAEKVFGPDDRRTPAIAMEDGADYGCFQHNPVRFRPDGE